MGAILTFEDVAVFLAFFTGVSGIVSEDRFLLLDDDEELLLVDSASEPSSSALDCDEDDSSVSSSSSSFDVVVVECEARFGCEAVFVFFFGCGWGVSCSSSSLESWTISWLRLLCLAASFFAMVLNAGQYDLQVLGKPQSRWILIKDGGESRTMAI